MTCPAWTARVSNRMPEDTRSTKSKEPAQLHRLSNFKAPLSRSAGEGPGWGSGNRGAAGAALDRILLRAGDRPVLLEAVGELRHAAHESTVAGGGGGALRDLVG